MKRGNADVAKVLLRGGATVNHLCSKHGTAMHYACSRQNVGLVGLLLDHGADANMVCDSHGSPLTATIAAMISWGDGRDRARDVAEILLRRGNYTQITEQDLLAAVNRIDKKRNYREETTSLSYGEEATKLSYGEELVRVLLEHDPNLKATASILATAAIRLGSSGRDTLRLLLQRDGGAGVTEAMLESAHEMELMEVLLQHRPLCAITPDVICNFSHKFPSSRFGFSYGPKTAECDLIRLLLDHDKDMLVTPAILSAVLGTDRDGYTGQSSTSQQTEELIEYLFARNTELEVTGSMVGDVHALHSLTVLLKHAPSMKVTPKMLFAASRITSWRSSDASDRARVLCLLAHDETATVPASLNKSILFEAWNSETLESLTVLLRRAPDLQLPSDFMLALTRRWPHVPEKIELANKHLELLVRYHKTVAFDDEVRSCIERSEDFDPEVKVLLYQLERKGAMPPGDKVAADRADRIDEWSTDTGEAQEILGDRKKRRVSL